MIPSKGGSSNDKTELDKGNIHGVCVEYYSHLVCVTVVATDTNALSHCFFLFRASISTKKNYREKLTELYIKVFRLAIISSRYSKIVYTKL